MGGIAVAGTDVHHLTLAELERANARSGGAERLAQRMRAALPIDEAVALVTCNRLEVFVHGPDAISATAVAQAFADAVGARGFAFAGQDAERHLLRVACSLESVAIGEDQILGQVRDGFAAARASGASGPRLTALCDLALRVGKRVRRETGLNHLGTDLARLALRHVKPLLRAPEAGPLALLGTGAMARAVMLARPKDARDRWLVVGRDRARTADFAAEFGAAGESLADFVAAAHPLRGLIAATSVAADAPLIDADFARRRVLPAGAIVDLGLPRNVAADVRAVANLADLADLRVVADRNSAELATTVATIEGWIDAALARHAQRATRSDAVAGASA